MNKIDYYCVGPIIAEMKRIHLMEATRKLKGISSGRSVKVKLSGRMVQVRVRFLVRNGKNNSFNFSDFRNAPHLQVRLEW
jgi:hypothetical protein